MKAPASAMKPKATPLKLNRGYGKESDVNVMYAEGDWEILEPLLDFLKHRHVRVYDPHTDGRPNETNIKIWIDRGIYNSKMSVIFLSRRWNEVVEYTFHTECAVTRFAQTVGRHRVLLVMLDNRRVPDNLRHFQNIYAWNLKKQPKDVRQHEKILDALSKAPRNKFRRGRLFWHNPYKDKDTGPEYAYIKDKKRRRFGKTEIVRHIGKVKTVFEHFELHCTFDRCTFRCQGNEVLEAYYHLQQCQFQQVQCRYCNQLIAKKKIAKHESERCLHKRVACLNNSCNGTFSVKEIEAHKKKCPFLEVECVNAVYNCKMRFRKLDEKKHMDSCPFVKIFCTGCRMEYFRRDVYSHKCEDALPKHFQKTDPYSSCTDMKRTETFNCKHQGCPFAGRWREYERHLVCCEYRRQRCEHCGERIAIKDITLHEQDCQTIDECQACGMEVPRSAKETHEFVCASQEISFVCTNCHTILDSSSKDSHDETCSPPEPQLEEPEPRLDTEQKEEETNQKNKDGYPNPKPKQPDIRNKGTGTDGMNTRGKKQIKTRPEPHVQPVSRYLERAFDFHIPSLGTIHDKSKSVSERVFDFGKAMPESSSTSSSAYVDPRGLKLYPMTRKKRDVLNHFEEYLERYFIETPQAGFFEMSSYW